MEPSGHPTEDLIEELIERGAIVVEGDRRGPSAHSISALPQGQGGWLWLPDEVFETGVDDGP